MKPFLSVLIACTFLLQTFVTIQAMPIQEGKMEISCIIKKEIPKKHTCCSVLNTQKENQSEKKGCCSGTSKMSCCISVISTTPSLYDITFTPLYFQKVFYGYIESKSSFEYDIFHPPILV